MSEQELRNRIAGIAESYIGTREGDAKHKKLIDTYNNHKPKSSSYKVTYTDAWCATAVSAWAIMAAVSDIFPLECSCNRMIALAKKMGIWVEKDSYIPEQGDAILYDWQDSGNGDCTGAADHVGLVTKCDGKTITVVEGNKSNAVGIRIIKVNGKNIRGFITPKYGTVVGNPSVSIGKASTASGTTAKATASNVQSTVKIQSLVTFKGGYHYVSANSAKPVGGMRTAGRATVTGIALGKKHPYHLQGTRGGSNVYGWVDANTIG